MDDSCRNTSQRVLPFTKPDIRQGEYDVYPVREIGNEKIFKSIEKLFPFLPARGLILIDGYQGIFFGDLIARLTSLYATKGISPDFINIAGCLKGEDEIEALVEEFIGGNDPLFGKRTHLSLVDFFDRQKLELLKGKIKGKNVIIYGTGASLISRDAFIIYIDLPKNEVQFRSRAGIATNIGTPNRNSKHDYKRNYFIDWIVQNRHKKSILPFLSIFVDGQRPEDITFISGDHLRETLGELSISVFRVRPWFEPGPWGGTWILDHIKDLSRDVPNYAWSFELITPENGLLLSSSGLMLEFSFDFLMYQESRNVLGDAHNRFGEEFPIRFDFLDTFGGGNLSVQCHPRPEYITQEFGETFAQEEAYYIIDAKEDALVYLGFQENIDPTEFRNALENSHKNQVPVDITRYVQPRPSKKHDFFLIPYGTIHGSGRNNLVLEISSTPYIFTFKMYDWLRNDLDGSPRALNINRAMENLYFEKKGKKVEEELCSQPVVIDRGDDWILEHMPTHPTHFYDVHRYIFSSIITIKTNNKCHVLSLVEGVSIQLETWSGYRARFNYVETFVVPAATREYRIVNESGGKAILVKAFVK